MTTRRALDRRVDAIAIGTSAGGVEALSVLLPSLRPRLGAAVFVVLHLPRDRPSVLPEILAPKCALPVREAEDKEPIQAGTVYVAPPDYHMLVEPGPQIAFSADDPVHYSRPSIDVLFESAAELYQERLVGIILTGANEDGAAGLAAVHRAGGFTIVQRPETAQAPLMVESALKQSPVNLVLSLVEIAVVLHTLGDGDVP